MHSRTVRRRIARAASAGTIVLASLLLAGPASAHDALTAASPAENTTLDAPPAEILLTFTGDIQEISPEIVVTDEAGSPATDAAPVVDGTAVSLALPPDMADGVWTVTWRVVSSDGHPISGEYAFTLAAGASSTPMPSEESPTASATDDAAPSSAADGDATASATPDVETGDGVPTGTAWALGVLALALVGVTTALVRRRAARGQSGDSTP